MRKIVYGTSDWLLNFAEVLLTLWASSLINSKPGFFYYPKGSQWIQLEQKLFEPYQAPSLDPKKALREAGVVDNIKIFSIQEMAEEGLGELTLKEIAEMIREKREIKAFRAINFPNLNMKTVYVSSKDKEWKRTWSHKSLREVLNSSQVKLGGAFLYFLYGAWLARHSEIIGILPRKQLGDVVGAFKAGEEYTKAKGKAQGKAKVFITGEFDFMTTRQWKAWETRGHRGWRKVPAWVIKKFLRSSWVEKIRRRVIREKKYTPFAYDERSESWYIYKIRGKHK